VFFRGSLGDSSAFRNTSTSIQRLFQENGISKSSVHVAIELFPLKPYQFAVVQKLQKENCVAKGTVL